MSADDERPGWDELEIRLAASTSVEEMAATVLAMVRLRGIKFQSCVILLAAHGKLASVLNETPYRDVLAMAHLLDLREPLVEEVLESGKSALASEQPAAAHRIFKDEKSVMCAPLMLGEKSLGVLYVGAHAAGVYESSDLDKVEVIASLAASALQAITPAVEAVRARTPAETLRSQLDAIQELAKSLSLLLKASAICKTVCDCVRLVLPRMQSVILFTRDTDDASGHALRAEYADTPYADYVRNLALRDDEGILGTAIRTGSTILESDTEMYDVQNLLGSEHSAIVAPLWSSGEDDGDESGFTSRARLLGCLYVGSATENTFTEEHRGLLETVAYMVAMALINARLFEQTQQMSLTDGLTGLYSHRLFHDKLAEEIEYARRHDQSIVLVMVDADNFTTYNDTLGHRAGDAMLTEIGSLLKDKVRSADVVCRYGGDEFAVLLKNTRKADAIRMCERIREAFQLRFGGNAVQVTASIGLACFPVDADSKKSLIKLAGEALKASRRADGNRVTEAGQLGPDSPGDGDEPPWQHPHTSPRKPPPGSVPGKGSRKMG